ncbi:MAG: SdrD B-like domain-containing protein, partial [Bacteroidota bacterium]
ENDRINGSHQETALGGLFMLPGASEIMTTSYDVLGVFDTGVRAYSTSNGDTERSYRIFRAENGLTGKGTGVGDIEAGCEDPTELQIGNYVWEDTNGDGIQQACEEPLVSVPVALYDANGNLIASTETDVNGEYYFSSLSANDPRLNWVGTDADTALQADTDYVIVFGTDGMMPLFDPTTGTMPLDDIIYSLTVSGTGEGNNPGNNDSDPAIAAAPGLPWDNFPFLTYTTGGAGQSDHTLDAGFTFENFDLALRKSLDTVATPGPYFPGSNVTYAIRVFNQGAIDATRINVFDYVPEGTTVVSGTNGAVTTFGGATANVTFSNGNFTIDALVSEDSLDLSITLKINTDFTGTSLDNFAEIRSADNDDDPTTAAPRDTDSFIDATNQNSPGELTPTDDSIDQNGRNGGDEDDHDIATITVVPCPQGNCGGAPSGTLND